MSIKLFDSELKVMEMLWKEGDLTAKQLTELLKESTGWSKTTTYTVIKKCIDKGVIERKEPNFLCHALVTKEEIQGYETSELVNKMFDNSPDLLVNHLLKSETLSEESIKRLKEMIQDSE